MKPIIALLVVTFAVGLGAQRPAGASSEVLFRAALQKEQIDHDLPAALEQYKALVEKFPKDAIAPQALAKIAAVYSKLNNGAAERETLDRLLREYATSPEAAAVRQRLSTASPSKFKETQLIPTGRADAMLGGGRVSPDGRYISFADQFIAEAGGTGNLALWDTHSGETTVVTKFSNVTPWAEGSAADSVWSPDGKELAYAWDVRNGAGVELRIVDRASGRHRIVMSSTTLDIGPLAWSPDRKQLLVDFGVAAGEGTTRTSELALVGVADGSKRVLRSFAGHDPGGGCFSPDGRYVAYDFQPDRSSESRDVAVVDLQTGREHVVTSDRSGHDLLLGWLPSGYLVFTSDRDGSTDAWAVRIVDGAPSGGPEVVKRDVGPLRPQGVTADGRVFVWKVVQVREIYVAEIDPATGQATRPPVPLPAAQPSVMRGEPAFSPDGSRIAYAQKAPGVAESIAVQTLATNEIRVYPVHVRNIDWPLWHPDGRSFIFDGTGPDDVQRTFQLNLETSTVTPISDSIVAGISPDGQYLWGETRRGQGLLRRSLKDNSTTVVIPLDEAMKTGIGGIELSPDGKWLAYLSRGGARGNATLFIRPAVGGPARALTSGFAAGYARIAWSPDSRWVFFNDNGTGLNRVSIDGGARQALGIRGGNAGFGMFTEKTMNADGRRLAFASSRYRTELWVWENVEPKRP